VGGLQDVLGVLQEGDEGLLGAVAHGGRRHRDVETLSPQDGFPAGHAGLGGGLVVGGGRRRSELQPKRCLLRVQSIAREVRGIP